MFQSLLVFEYVINDEVGQSILKEVIEIDDIFVEHIEDEVIVMINGRQAHPNDRINT